MSTEAERILIQRLVAGELDELEAERVRALIERDPELAELLEQLKDLQSRVLGAFPDPPPLGDRRAFVELMGRLSAAGRDPDGEPDSAWPLSSMRVGSAATFSAPRSRGAVAPRAAFDVTSPRWGEPSVGAHLFNLREIQRDEGLAVELEFYAGDVLAIHHEVLLVSAFAGSYQPTPGSLFGSIAERYGVSFASGPPPDTRRYPDGLLHFSGISCPAFDSLWVIELKEPGQPFSLQDLRRALRAVGDRLPDMLADASSITLPLLGTGNQQLNPRDVARELLSALPGWARSPRLRTIRVFTLELEHVALLNRALDDREFSVASSALFAACQELQRALERRDWSEPVRIALKDLLKIASAPDPSMQSIALEGRRVAEIVLRLLSREDDTETEQITASDEAARRRRTDLAAPQLQLLLVHGRSAAAGEPIDSNDAVMILFAAMQVAQMTRISRVEP